MLNKSDSNNSDTFRFCLRKSLNFLACSDGIAVEGLPKIQIIRGVLSETVLFMLLEELSKPNSRLSLAEKLTEAPSDAITEVLEQLWRWNLLQEHREEALEQQPLSNMLDRWALASVVDDEAETAPFASWLKHSTVEINVSDLKWFRFIELLQEQLEGCGCKVKVSDVITTPPSRYVGQLGTVKLLGPGLGCSLRRGSQPLVVFVGYGATKNSFRFGPTVYEKEFCLQCVDDVLRSSNLEYGMSEVYLEAAAALCGWELTDILLQRPTAISRQRVREYDLETCESLDVFLPSHSLTHTDPHHQICGPAIDMASTFNDRVSDEYGGGELSSNKVDRRTVRGRSEFAASPRLSLPTGRKDVRAVASRSLPKSARANTHRSNLDMIAYLFGLSLGVRAVDGKRISRWTPTAGNLGSPQAHILAFDVEGLSPGLYSYEASTHSLVDRRSVGTVGIEEIGTRLFGKPARAGGFSIIITARRDLLRAKYREFSYKLAHLDSGVLSALLIFLANAADSTLWPLQGWPDELINKELNLNAEDEKVTAVLTPARPRTDQQIFSLWPQFSGNPSNAYLTTPGTCDLKNYLALISDRDQMQEGLTSRSGKRKAERPDYTSLIRLPQAAQSSMSFSAALVARKSVREFVPCDIPLGVLTTILDSACGPDSTEWSCNQMKTVPLIYTVLLRQRAEKCTQVFRVWPSLNALSKESHPRDFESLRRCFVQPEFASAPITVLISAPLAKCVQATGLSGYRLLLSRAGAAAFRMWMAGITVGLEGTIHAGLKTFFLREAMPSLSGESVLFACSLGLRAGADR